MNSILSFKKIFPRKTGFIATNTEWYTVVRVIVLGKTLALIKYSDFIRLNNGYI